MALHSWSLYPSAMKKYLILLASIFLFSCTSEELSLQLPEPVANQSSAILIKDGAPTAYSFYGLDSTKSQSGVHKKTMRLNLETGLSQYISDVPDSLGRLASSASVIQNKAYIAGGYAVFPDGSEKSSNQLYEFNPEDESYQLLAPIPVPIDDHIQTVYQDSLIYLISGWSDSTNVNNVQIYNPSNDLWTAGTPLPDETEAKTFGGVGIIVSDTIYALGGATFAKNYPPGKGLYKGAISKENPTEINWIKEPAYPGPFRYRSGVFSQNGKIYFFGGSNETYNYNAISYAEKTSVSPNKTILVYEIKTGLFEEIETDLAIMDLRNLVQDRDGHVYAIGGIGENQEVLSAIQKIDVR